MRTAKDIYESHVQYEWDTVSEHLKKSILEAITVAQIDAIKECAEMAKSEWIRYGKQMGHEVDKNSILRLINDLK